MFKYFGISITFLLIVFSNLNAGGLSTPFAEIKVENITPGETISITGIANKPFTAKNTSDHVVRLKVDVVAPEVGELKDGYVAIPDTSWVKLEKDVFDLGAGEEAQTQVSLTVPKKGKYAGKKYQVYLWSHTIPTDTGMSLAVGLKSRFLLETVQQKGFFKRLFGG